ncbi:TIGR03643 family protein [Acinetobacter apis]|uniref:TIGR03643 family protein n=1 Tax=Acinetobacter apis TaxID=1229165 RepID=A0A217EDR1_9GAMM|nr:TIGR03643 family protein [Acinetobacter apis]SNQ28643.1 TIGR03643 family protein [Acinetobacter apis]
MATAQNHLSVDDVSRIIEMAWEDRTPFEAIEIQFGLSEPATIQLMRSELKASSFKLWRKRVTSRKSKHLKLRSPDISRAYCSRQYKPS